MWGGDLLLRDIRKMYEVVPVKSEGVVKDIDTWQDYKKGFRRNKH